jgi:hypothetical protein
MCQSIGIAKHDRCRPGKARSVHEIADREVAGVCVVSIERRSLSLKIKPSLLYDGAELKEFLDEVVVTDFSPAAYI